ncbi:fungal transcriptional regulatory [Fusarium longipes]|uniref:Fungal transcriptional regulatory n=1 Tax=Fusarium longipes TaxID=694270 RepID=A0A395TB94_9HYPO|nr:fungal transcriptional regulatory [Fusarium longipes]
MRDRALFHKSQATQSLANLLPYVDSDSVDIALVSCLLLCMSELFDGTSAGWKHHLEGAKRLLSTLKAQKSTNMAGGHLNFFIKLARFLDSAATTSTCKPPLIDNTTAKDMPEATEDTKSDDTAVYGIPKELFHMVDRVNNLASKRGTRVDEQSEALFRQEADRVQVLLDTWAYDYGGLAGAVASLSPTNDDVLHATTAYEWALRLRLHQITEGYALSEKVSSCVKHILDSTQKIRYGSSLETCLLFPLVMAGSACNSVEERMVIQDRLMIMERTCGFGYIYQSRELVETVWKRRETESMVNWARIRYEEMGGLALY